MNNIRTYEITHSEPKTFPIQQKDSTAYLLGGCLVLKNGRIDKYQFEEGYCLARKAGDKDYFTFCYYDKDHLGNIRQVTQDYNGISNGKVIQTMNYYPFGAEFCDNRAKSFVQNHKYNGKEFDHMHGLNTYDYGARQYNPVTARWDRMDPLCEKYYNVSPYNYCLNNPIKLVDPDGKAPGPGDFFFKLDDAAKDFGKYTNPMSIKNNREYATSFYKMTNDKGQEGYSYTQPSQGGPAGATSLKFISRDKKSGKVTVSKTKTAEKAVSKGHSHGAYDEKSGIGNDVFSGLGELWGKDAPEERKKISNKSNDIGGSNDAKLQDYVVTPSGTLQHYDSSTGEVRIVDTNMPKDDHDKNKIEDITAFYGKK